jgi:hypothetical protein
MSVRPVVAGMRLGGRSPDARTGCGMHIRYGVEGVGGRERTAFSVLGTMVDLVQCLYHPDMALMGKVHRWAVGSLRIVVVVGVRNGSREMLRLACCFPSINKHLLPLPLSQRGICVQPIGDVDAVGNPIFTCQNSHPMTSHESSPTFSSST